MTLGLAVKAPVSQRFAGAAEAEPAGWFQNAKDGRPLRSVRAATPGWIKHIDFHQGLDQYAPTGTDLFAIEAGRVASIDKAIGEVIVLFQGQVNSRYRFNHCASILVAVGAKVSKGQHIAEMGALGNATGPHLHLEIGFRERLSDGTTRWVQYDPARFYPERTFRFGLPYRAEQVKKGTCDPLGYLYGGSNLYDDRIYPIRQVTINPDSFVRKLPDRTSDPLLLTPGPTTAAQVNEVPGGAYELGGMAGNLWAKVKLPINGVASTGFVAKPLVK